MLYGKDLTLWEGGPTKLLVSLALCVLLPDISPAYAAETSAPSSPDALTVEALSQQSTQELVQAAMEATTHQNWDAAVQLYQAALQREPNNVGIYNNLGVVLRRYGDLAGAIAAYRQALTLDPTLDTAVHNLILALLANRNWQEALDLIVATETRFPDMGILQLYRGLAYEKLEEWTEAIQAYQQYTQQSSTAVGYYRLAVAHWQSGNGSEAAKAFRRATQLEPTIGFYSSEAGRALATLGIWEEATLFLERLPDNWPDPADFVVLARLAHQLEQNTGAREALDQALRLAAPRTADQAQVNPNAVKPDPSWLSDVGVLEADTTANYKAATDYLMTAIAQFETSPRPDPQVGAIAYTNLADLYWTQEQFDLALAAAQQAIALQPNLPQAHNTLAAILVSLEFPKEAVTHLKQATDLDPTYWQAYRNLSIAYALLGDQDQSTQALQKAITQAPTLDIVDTLNQELMQLQRIEPLSEKALDLK